MSNKTLNLDLAKDPLLPPIIYGRVGDADMQTITVNITSRDIPVNLTGYIITFEGITNGKKTKVFDVDGVDLTEPSKGTFTYTFPSMAFAVSGNYEIAYFSITQSGKRDTTGEFKIIVIGNADIDAAEAETIITEYNNLVKELHEITDKYVSDSDVKFADLNQRITDLQALITQYNIDVQKIADYNMSLMNSTKDDAINLVNTTTTTAIQTIKNALAEFQSGDFYTKLESDSIYATIADMSQKSDDAGVVHNTGDETITGKKTFTDDTTLKNLEVSDAFVQPVKTISFKLPYCAQNNLQLVRVGNLVFAQGTFSASSVQSAGTLIANGTYPSEVIPEGFRPTVVRQDFRISKRSANSGEYVGRINLLPDGKMTDMTLYNSAFSSTNDAMLISSGAVWATADTWPIN